MDGPARSRRRAAAPRARAATGRGRPWRMRCADCCRCARSAAAARPTGSLTSPERAELVVAAPRTAGRRQAVARAHNLAASCVGDSPYIFTLPAARRPLRRRGHWKAAAALSTRPSGPGTSQHALGAPAPSASQDQAPARRPHNETLRRLPAGRRCLVASAFHRRYHSSCHPVISPAAALTWQPYCPLLSSGLLHIALDAVWPASRSALPARAVVPVVLCTAPAATKPSLCDAAQPTLHPRPRLSRGAHGPH
jgi:hypothetical protein